MEKKNVNPFNVRRVPLRISASNSALVRIRFSLPNPALCPALLPGTRQKCACAPSDGQTCAAACTPGVDHGPATGGFHARAESVSADATRFGGLIGALHNCLGRQKGAYYTL